MNGLANLTPSTIAGLKIDQADVDGTLADGTLTIRRGGRHRYGCERDACGTVAFGETGASALDVTVDADDLTAIGTWSGQPITGAGHVEAHLTGPHDQPDARAVFAPADRRREDVSALTFNGDLQASMPGWRLADAKFSTKSEGTFLKVKSVEVTRVTGQASYANNQIASTRILADATARAADCRTSSRCPRRTARFRETLSTHDRRRDVDAAGGTTAVVRADSTKIEVKELTLTKGAQRVSVDGVFALTPRRRRPPPGCASGSNRYGWPTRIAWCSGRGVSKAS